MVAELKREFCEAVASSKVVFQKYQKKILKKFKKLAFNLISWIIYIIKKNKHSSSDVALSNHSIFQQILTLTSHYTIWKMFFNIGIQLFFHLKYSQNI